MAGKRTHPDLPRPEDVLAGRVRVRAEQLFALIHAVNPTGEESPRERERYALKSRLQALLLTRFGDEVEVHADPENPDVVGLRHRSGLRDACHALLSQLPVEARALVRRRLDQAEAAGSHEEPETRKAKDVAATPSPPDPEDEAASPAGVLHARGRKAVEAYDYEEARRLLTRACEAGAGIAAARDLLELLVDVLVDDEAALSLEDRLCASEASDPGVRGLLALAAARSSQAERALRLARSLDGSLAARVESTLARNALDASDLAGAAAHLEAARRADPAEPSLRSLEDDLARRRDEERRPAEAALLELHAAGTRDAAVDAAKDLLRRWPDSAVARRIVREIEEASRRERGLALESEGRAALDEGDPARAVRLLSRALSEGASSGVPDLLAAARHALESRAADDAVRATVAALDGPDLPVALSTYAALPPELRLRVRAPARQELLSLLDEVLAADPGEKPRVAADAALALKAAGDALRGGDAGATLGILESHHRALARVPRASVLARAAEARLASVRAVLARDALEDARARLGSGDLDGAAAALEGLRKGDLDPDGLAELVVVRSALRREEEARRSRREERALEEARRALRLAISREPHAADELADCDGDAASTPYRIALGAGGRELVLTSVYGPWLFVRVVDVHLGQVTRRFSLKLPHAPGDLETTLVEGSRLTVLGERVGFAQLDLQTGEVSRTGSLASALPAGAIVETTTLVPGSRLAWIEVSTLPDRRPFTFHVNLENGRARTKVASDLSPMVAALGPSALVLVEDEGRIRILNVEGLPATGAPFEIPIDVEGAGPAPAGQGLLLAGPRRDPMDPLRDVEGELVLLEVVPDVATGVRREVPLEEAPGSYRIAIAAARLEETAFVLSVGGTESRVHSVSADLDPRQPVAATPAETALFSDAESDHAVAACWWGERFAALPLLRRTQWPGWDGALARRDPFSGRRPLEDDYRCRTTSRASNAMALATYARLVDVPAAALATQVDEVAKNASDGDELEALLGALARIGSPYTFDQRVEHELRRRFPSHRYAVTSTVREHAREGRWDRVLATTEGLAPGTADSLPAHVRHLRAVALARTGEIRAALTLLESIRADDDSECQVDDLADLLREVVASSPSDSPVGRLVGTVKEALSASAAGDSRRVIDLLDRGLLWSSELLQGHALLAKAWLEIDSAAPRELFRKRRALARLLDLIAGPGHRRRDLPPLPGGLDQAAVSEVAARAGAFLDR